MLPGLVWFGWFGPPQEQDGSQQLPPLTFVAVTEHDC